MVVVRYTTFLRQASVYQESGTHKARARLKLPHETYVSWHIPCNHNFVVRSAIWVDHGSPIGPPALLQFLTTIAATLAFTPLFETRRAWVCSVLSACPKPTPPQFRCIVDRQRVRLCLLDFTLGPSLSSLLYATMPSDNATRPLAVFPSPTTMSLRSRQRSWSQNGRNPKNSVPTSSRNTVSFFPLCFGHHC